MVGLLRLPFFALLLVVSIATPTLADSYLVYGESGIPPATDLFVWCDIEPNCVVDTPIQCNNPEGGQALSLLSNAYIGFGVFNQTPQDLAAYDGGDLKFWALTPFDLKVEMQCFDGGLMTYTKFISDYGFDGTLGWQEYTIPICDFFPGGTCSPTCLAEVRSPFMSTIELPELNGYLIDDVRWEKSNAGSHTGATPVTVQGRQILVNGEPFVMNGIAYSPLSIGENWTGAWRDRPDRYNVDFPLMAQAGINTVRLYAPILSTAMLDAAWANGLYVVPNFGVSPAQLGCPEGRAFMQGQLEDMVTKWKDHPAVLFWLMGNEVNINLDGNDLCLDWYPQLDALAAAIKAIDTAHPVATSVAGVDDICLAGCSDDTSLPNLDIWGAQLYQGCTFISAFNQYANYEDCARPLVLTEFGADAYDSRDPGEDQTYQADCLGSLLAEAESSLAARSASGVSSGQIVFEWVDEWWKADPDASNPENTCVDGGTAWDQHDSCASFLNFAYPDIEQQEEWWGVATNNPLDAADRGLRTSYTTLSEVYQLGDVCNMEVTSFDDLSGEATLSFDPAAGAADHTLYYGLLSNVDSYNYTGAIGDLGAAGSGSVTLPPGSVYWVVAARNDVEGCYGLDSDGVERPNAGSVPQAANRNCQTCVVP